MCTNFSGISAEASAIIHEYANMCIVIENQAVTLIHDCANKYLSSIFGPRLSRKRGTLKLIRPSDLLSVRPSVCPSVTKTLTLLISSEVLMIEHWHLACMILMTSPFNWHHAVTLTFTFYSFLLKFGCTKISTLMVTRSQIWDLWQLSFTGINEKKLQ